MAAKKQVKRTAKASAAGAAVSGATTSRRIAKRATSNAPSLPLEKGPIPTERANHYKASVRANSDSRLAMREGRRIAQNTPKVMSEIKGNPSNPKDVKLARSIASVRELTKPKAVTADNRADVVRDAKGKPKASGVRVNNQFTSRRVVAAGEAMFKGGAKQAIKKSALRGAGAVGAVYGAGEVGYAVGTAINKKFNVSGKIVDAAMKNREKKAVGKSVYKKKK